MPALTPAFALALVLAAASTPAARAQGRLRPPEFVTCDRNHLTAFTGRVVALSREADRTTLRLESDEGTKERFTLRHPGGDATPWFYRGGTPFSAADWVVLMPDGRLPAGARATVWVCSDEPNPRVDWEVPPAGAASGSSGAASR